MNRILSEDSKAKGTKELLLKLPSAKTEVQHINQLIFAYVIFESIAKI